MSRHDTVTGESHGVSDSRGTATTLVDIRNRLDDLATPAGPYVLVCDRTGDRPVPVADASFPDRETARRAARLAVRYRAVLREYDPRLPTHDVVVRRRTEAFPDRHVRCDGDGDWSLTAPVLTGDGERASIE